MRLILPMPGNERFAEGVAYAGGWEIGRLESRCFPDEESYVRLTTSTIEVSGGDGNYRHLPSWKTMLLPLPCRL